MVSRKTLPFRVKHRAEYLLLCSPVAQQSCWSCGCLRTWPPSTLKNPNCFGSNGTGVSPYMLGCCLFLTSTALLCAKSIQARKAGVGAASSASGNGLHLQWTYSFCFMSWKHENCIFGQWISKQSYKGFGFFLKEKKRCKIKCMFTCPRSKVLNTKVTLSWMDRPLSLDSGTSCPFPLHHFTVTLFFPQEKYLYKNSKQLNVQAIKSWVWEDPLYKF